jgi:hypothetical protein
MEPTDTNAAYAEGYAHGSILLLAMRQGGDMPDPVRAIHARYLAQAQMTDPTEAERAYIAGFRDAVSDNLPCPPHPAAESMPRRRVA